MVIILLGGFVTEKWNDIEPIAWLVSIPITIVCSIFAPHLPIICKWPQQVALTWCLKRTNRIVDLDIMEKIISGDEDE